MLIETKLSCGDTGYIYRPGLTKEVPGHAVGLTIGQVRVEFTKSSGLKRGQVFQGCVLSSDNTLPKNAEYREMYMCVETGIGSGSVFEFGKTIFLTKEEALKSGEEESERLRQYFISEEIRKRDELLREERAVRAKLARIEAAKATASTTDAGVAG